MPDLDLQDYLTDLFERADVRRMVISAPKSGASARQTVRVFAGKDGPQLQWETTAPDGKAFHRNTGIAQGIAEICGKLPNEYRQLNIQTAQGNSQVRFTKGGKMLLDSHIPPNARRTGQTPSHDARRNYPFPEGVPTPFLHRLDIMDATGRVHPGSRDKFRQINRYVEFIADILPVLPREELVAVDLCCGKGVLTFAAYVYLTQQAGRRVHMAAVDRKADMMALCGGLARELGLEGLTFEQGDIADMPRLERADLVIALHACDTATDLALYRAIRWDAKAILCAPCCQHELSGQLKQPALAHLTDYPILHGRLSEMLTDSLRALALKAVGYQVQLCEFVALEHTPKNLLIRAVRQNAKPDASLIGEYQKLCAHYNVRPALGRMLGWIE